MSSSNSFQTQNPATLEFIEEYEYSSYQKTETLLQELYFNQKKWQGSLVSERIQYLKNIAASFLNWKEQLAISMTIEMGKPISDGVAEVEKCARCALYYAEHLEEFLQSEQVVLSRQSAGTIYKEPFGVIFAIMPWNFPVWQLARFALPAIAAGNAVLMKHSDITAGTAKLIEKVFTDVGGITVFRNAHLSHQDSALVIADPRIQGVTFTGSTRGGKEVAGIAGQNLKKTVLELGGSDAYLILQDADLELAAKACAQSRMVNGGQSCVAAKRFIVHQSKMDEFIHNFSSELEKFKVGDPKNKLTVRGPLAHKKFQLQIHEQVLAINKKAIQIGGKLPNEVGAYYPATILIMENSTKKWDQEFFGPVACVWSFSDDAQAIEMANHSIYGLGGALFSKDHERAMSLAKKLECGIVGINEMVKSDPSLPFGGVKNSGYGRELSRYGLYEFLNIKSVTTRLYDK